MPSVATPPVSRYWGGNVRGYLKLSKVVIKKLGSKGWNRRALIFLGAWVLVPFMAAAFMGCGHASSGQTETPVVTPPVIPAPTISTFTASPQLVASGGTATLHFVFSGGDGVIDQGIGAVTNGIDVVTGALVSDKTFTLTVTNSLKETISSQATVKINTNPPVISAFASNPAVATEGDLIHLEWSVANATSLIISNNIGKVTGLTSVPVMMNSVGTFSYTLLASNSFGTSTASAQIKVVERPVITGLGPQGIAVIPYTTTTLNPVFSHGTGTIDHGIGTVVSGATIPVGPITSNITYTLTVTNEAGNSIAKSEKIFVSTGFFSLLPSTLSAPASNSSLVLLPDGKVLVTIPPDRADLFDPKTGLFSPLGNFPVGGGLDLNGQIGNIATLLPDGKVLVLSQTRGNASLDIWDPGTNTHAPVTMAHPHATASLLSTGKVLLADESDGSYQAELFDPVAMSVSPVAMGQLVGAGRNSILLRTGNVLLRNSSYVELFDVQSSLFLPTGAAGLVSYAENPPVLLKTAPLAGMVLFLGGYAGGVLNTAVLYQPASNSFRRTGDMQIGGSKACTVVLASGEVLVAGGNIPGPSKSSCELFDPATETFQLTGFMNSSRYSAGSVLLPDGKALIVGGIDANYLPLSTAELYDRGDGLKPSVPDATLTCPTSTRNGAAGLTASLPDTPNASYFWQIKGGTVVSGWGTRTVTFTAGSPGKMALDCLVVSVDHIPAQAHAEVTVLP